MLCLKFKAKVLGLALNEGPKIAAQTKSFKINIMKEISISESGFTAMCRLCLSSETALSDIFCFSSEMENTVAGVIMKWAAVQITRGDEMPDFICQMCYTQLEKTHQFLMQTEKSDRILRRYLQQLYTSDKPIKAESSVQPFKDPLIVKTENDFVKCESLELNDGFNIDLNSIPDNNRKEELCLKHEIKVEPIDANLFLRTECETGPEDISSNIHGKEFSCEDSKRDAIAVNWKEQENHLLTNKLKDKMIPKFEMKVEQMEDNLFIQTGSVADTVNASSNGDGMEIRCENTQINIGHTSENSINITENFSSCDETHKDTPVNRKKHKKTNILKSFNCEICTKFFSSPSGLYYHKRTHTGEKPYKCNVCVKCFYTSGELKIHQRIHTGEKPYQCDLCNKCFFRLSHLSTHKFEHTGEKPYQCDLCNMCFARSSNLKRHKLKHAGEKPHQCDICNKSFLQISNLTLHKRIHTGEKPYQCDFCNKCFSQSSHLNKHKRTHTGEEPYECNICYKCFSQSSKLNEHKLVHS